MVSNVGITIRPKAGRNCNVHYHVRATNANALEAKRGVRKYIRVVKRLTPLCSSLATILHSQRPTAPIYIPGPSELGLKGGGGYNCPLPCFMTVVV